MNSPPLLVVCLCAQWCGSCRDYAAVFAEALAEFGANCRFLWLDIEDDAELTGSVDIDDFPTLLIAREGRPLFFGAVTPHPQTLQRLVASGLAGDLKISGIAADVGELAARLA